MFYTVVQSSSSSLLASPFPPRMMESLYKLVPPLAVTTIPSAAMKEPGHPPSPAGELSIDKGKAKCLPFYYGTVSAAVQRFYCVIPHTSHNAAQQSRHCEESHTRASSVRDKLHGVERRSNPE